MLFLYGFLQTILLPLLLLLNIESTRNRPLSHTVPSSHFYDALRVLFGVTAVPLMLIFSVVFVLQLFAICTANAALILSCPAGRPDARCFWENTVQDFFSAGTVSLQCPAVHADRYSVPRV